MVAFNIPAACAAVVRIPQIYTLCFGACVSVCVSEQEQLDAHIVCARRRQARTHARSHASGDVSELAHGSAVYHKMIYNGIILIIKIESRSRVAAAHLRTNGARTRTRAHTKAHHAADASAASAPGNARLSRQIHGNYFSIVVKYIKAVVGQLIVPILNVRWDCVLAWRQHMLRMIWYPIAQI